MASHSRAELRDAAQALGRAALQVGFRPGTGAPVAAAQEDARARRGAELDDVEQRPAPFDGQADLRRAA